MCGWLSLSRTFHHIFVSSRHGREGEKERIASGARFSFAKHFLCRFCRTAVYDVNNCKIPELVVPDFKKKSSRRHAARVNIRRARPCVYMGVSAFVNLFVSVLIRSLHVSESFEFRSVKLKIEGNNVRRQFTEKEALLKPQRGRARMRSAQKKVNVILWKRNPTL